VVSGEREQVSGSRVPLSIRGGAGRKGRRGGSRWCTAPIPSRAAPPGLAAASASASAHNWPSLDWLCNSTRRRTVRRQHFRLSVRHALFPGIAWNSCWGGPKHTTYFLRKHCHSHHRNLCPIYSSSFHSMALLQFGSLGKRFTFPISGSVKCPCAETAKKSDLILFSAPVICNLQRIGKWRLSVMLLPICKAPNAKAWDPRERGLCIVKGAQSKDLVTLFGTGPLLSGVCRG